jgi:hypothetical protein
MQEKKVSLGELKWGWVVARELEEVARVRGFS